MISNNIIYSNWWGQTESVRSHPGQAVLLHADPGMGVAEFGLELVAANLCQSPEPDASACGRCPSCKWVMDGQHPDFRWIRPDADAAEDGSAEDAEPAAEAQGSKKAPSKEIRIDQIRGLNDFTQISSHRGGERFVLLGPIEKMNHAAANALLKSLEEPNPGQRFVLVAEGLASVPATVLSRCRRIQLKADHRLVSETRVSGSESAAWLLPLLRSGRVSPADWAERAGKADAAEVIGLLSLWLTDLGRVLSGAEPRHFPQDRASLAGQAGPASAAVQRRVAVAEGLFELSQLARRASHPLNPRLFMETVFEAFRGAIMYK